MSSMIEFTKRELSISFGETSSFPFPTSILTNMHFLHKPVFVNLRTESKFQFKLPDLASEPNQSSCTRDKD